MRPNLFLIDLLTSKYCIDDDHFVHFRWSEKFNILCLNKLNQNGHLHCLNFVVIEKQLTVKISDQRSSNHLPVITKVRLYILDSLLHHRGNHL